MDAQLQIRQNAMEVQDYMRDLLQWQQSLKDKTASQASSSSQNVPAVRGRSAGPVGKAPADLQQPALRSGSSIINSSQRNASPAAHTYKNYSKWDKFDADAALDDAHAALNDADGPAAVQQRATAGPASSSQPTMPQPEIWAQTATGSNIKPAASQPTSKPSQPSITPLATATNLKDRGNKLFQAGHYDDAMKCYSQSINTQPTSIAYANRAMAYLKLGRYVEAEQDCTAAVAMEGSYVKALHRRGTARRQLGKLLEAAGDFEEAFRLEPSNKSLLADRDSALAQYLQQQNIKPNTAWSSIPVTVVQQQLQPTQQQQVQELSPVQPLSGSQQQKEQQQRSVQQQGAPAAAGVGKNAGSLAAAAAAAQLPSGELNGNSNNSSMMQRPFSGTSTGPPTPRDEVPSLVIAAASAGSNASKSPSPRAGMATAAAAAAAAAAAQLASKVAAGLKAPKTSNEFEATWRSFKGDKQLQVSTIQVYKRAAGYRDVCSGVWHLGCLHVASDSGPCPLCGCLYHCSEKAISVFHTRL
eukprot:GHRR01012605.1.p1 GENE.GHRR01012605.1~~GHRR01012605.1.p1  ORF type:complete len:527 (+),score=243.09 GHRR01012605.1:615-2195(+)